MANIIAIDIGYGFTKATNGQDVVIFPSIVGDVVKADFDNELVKAGKGKVITLNGQEYFYGHHAQKHSRNPHALFARERTDQEDIMRVLFLAALVELGIEGKVKLCTGLPVDWFADKEQLERLLIGKHTFAIDGQEQSIMVCQVAIVPQPFGSFFDAILTNDGQLADTRMAKGKVGILDIGTFTCDLALSDGLEYIAKASGSKTIAMSTVWRQIRDAIKSEHGLEYELHQIDAIMRNGRHVTVKGQDRDISQTIQPAIDSLAAQVLSFARETWGNAQDFKRIILTGGGSQYLEEQVKAVYPHAHILTEPHKGNLRGFHKYAMRKFS